MTATHVRSFLDVVVDELDDLPEPQRTELLEDLAGHLREVEAEGDLYETLGDPVAYARELRVAAGMGPVAPPVSVPYHVRARADAESFWRSPQVRSFRSFPRRTAPRMVGGAWLDHRVRFGWSPTFPSEGRRQRTARGRIGARGCNDLSTAGAARRERIAPLAQRRRDGRVFVAACRNASGRGAICQRMARPLVQRRRQQLPDHVGSSASRRQRAT